MASIEWKDFVPSHLIPQILCGCLDHFSHDTVTAVICTKNKQLLEINQFIVTCSCNIPLETCERVSIFYSYSPDYTYYLVEASKELCVIKKDKKLEVIRRYDDVVKIEVTDDFHCGFPQVHIYLSDEFEPVITDFTERQFSYFSEKEKPQDTQSEFAFSLSRNLQAMKLKLDECKQKLKEKKRLRAAALYNFTENSVSADGDFMSESNCKKKAYDTAGILVSSTWQKLHNDKWVIGIEFRTTSWKVSELELILDAEEYSSQMLRLNRQPTDGGSCRISDTGSPRPDHFQPATSLPPNSTAYFLAVMESPCFKDSSHVSVGGVISYQIKERKFQSALPPFSLRAEDLLNDTLLPFSKSLEITHDLLSATISSKSMDLIISTPCTLDCSVDEILTKRLKFKFLAKIGYYYNETPSNIGLRGMLLFYKTVASTSFFLSLFGRNSKQLILFLNCLKNYLPDQTSITKYSAGSCEVNIDDGLESLKAELKLIAITMEGHIVGENINVPKSEWKIFRQNLNKLECRTDSILNRLSNSCGRPKS
nr:PREDICTED: uncharacterized protein LOC109039106 [Bemisia tabaci]